MTNTALRDLCIVKTIHYRSLLNTAFAGTSSYSSHNVADDYRNHLLFWEGVAAVGDYAQLTPEQRLVVDLAAAASAENSAA